MTPADLSTDSPAGAFAEGSPGPAAGFAPPRPVAGGRLFWPALGLALAAVFFVKMSDYDIFYHLAIGREIARLGRLPEAEFYLYPALGEAVRFHEWGFALIVWLAERLAGPPGLALLNALVAAATLALFYRAGEIRAGLARHGATARMVGLALLFVVVLVACRRMVYRPEMALYLAMGAQILLLELYGRDGRWRWLLGLPVLSFLLAQFHPSGFLLWGVFGIYALQFLITAERGARPGLFGGLLALGLAMVGAHLINPYHWHQALIPFQFATRGELTGTNAEYLPIWMSARWREWLALAVLAGYALVKSPRQRPVDWILVIGFALFAARYERNLALFGLMMVVPLMHLAATIAGEIGRREARGFALAALILFALALGRPIRHDLWGWGPWEARMPESMAAHLAAHDGPGRLFNGYGLGGYFAWRLYPGQKIFIDGRHYEVSEMLTSYSDVAFTRPGWQEVLARWEVDSVAMPALNAVTGTLMPVVGALARDEGWRFRGVEAGALLFVRAERAADVPMLTGADADTGVARAAPVTTAAAGIEAAIALRRAYFGPAPGAAAAGIEARILAGDLDGARAALEAARDRHGKSPALEAAAARLARAAGG